LAEHRRINPSDSPLLLQAAPQEQTGNFSNPQNSSDAHVIVGLGLGYNFDAAASALARNAGNVERAVNWLMEPGTRRLLEAEQVERKESEEREKLDSHLDVNGQGNTGWGAGGLFTQFSSPRLPSANPGGYAGLSITTPPAFDNPVGGDRTSVVASRKKRADELACLVSVMLDPEGTGSSGNDTLALCQSALQVNDDNPDAAVTWIMDNHGTYGSAQREAYFISNSAEAKMGDAALAKGGSFLENETDDAVLEGVDDCAWLFPQEQGGGAGSPVGSISPPNSPTSAGSVGGGGPGFGGDEQFSPPVYLPSPTNKTSTKVSATAAKTMPRASNLWVGGGCSSMAAQILHQSASGKSEGFLVPVTVAQAREWLGVLKESSAAAAVTLLPPVYATQHYGEFTSSLFSPLGLCTPGTRGAILGIYPENAPAAEEEKKSAEGGGPPPPLHHRMYWCCFPPWMGTLD